MIQRTSWVKRTPLSALVWWLRSWAPADCNVVEDVYGWVASWLPRREGLEKLDWLRNRSHNSLGLEVLNHYTSIAVLIIAPPFMLSTRSPVAGDRADSSAPETTLGRRTSSEPLSHPDLTLPASPSSSRTSFCLCQWIHHH